MCKFIKKPIEIDAIQWDSSNAEEIKSFIGDKGSCVEVGADNFVIDGYGNEISFYVGDWIIKGVDGEFYPCPNRVFEATYSKVAA